MYNPKPGTTQAKYQTGHQSGPCVWQPVQLMSKGYARKTSANQYPISALSQWLRALNGIVLAGVSVLTSRS